jgi:protein-S-isoprenylcysteine O-methyltransferase Ste14
VSKLAGGIAFALFVHLWWRAGAVAAGPVWLRMDRAPAIVWDLALLGFFFIAHSGFASETFKRRVGLPREAMRRLYLLLTLPVMLLVWALFVPLGQPVIWDARGWLDWPFFALRLVALAGLIWTVRSFSLADFFGEPLPNAAGGSAARLSVAGAFALCRHPLYFFMTLLAAAETYMPLGRALLAGALLVYVAIGSWLEEAKLEREFGPDYAGYRSGTPWLVPTPASIGRALISRRAR